MNSKLDEVIAKLIQYCDPISIFIYGSRARKDFQEKSDWEIGVLMLKKRYIRRSKLKKIIADKSFSIYPFEYENFVKGKIDTPFNRPLFLRELALSGKIIYGERIIKKINLPAIRVIDIIQDLRFNLGYAFAAMHSFRNGDKFTASYEFYKSCLYGTRCLEILKLRKFPKNYNEIEKFSKRLSLGEHKPLITAAINIRNRKKKLEEKVIFQNISYLNELIEQEIIKYFSKHGNRILIK